MSAETPIVNNRASFKNEARHQRVCAVCHSPGAYDPHHVVEKKELKKRGLSEWDTRNALRLCKILGAPGGNCHSRHTTYTRLVKTGELRDENIEFAFEALGLYAYDYLRRHYDDSEEDPRVAEILERG